MNNTIYLVYINMSELALASFFFLFTDKAIVYHYELILASCIPMCIHRVNNSVHQHDETNIIFLRMCCCISSQITLYLMVYIK